MSRPEDAAHRPRLRVLITYDGDEDDAEIETRFRGHASRRPRLRALPGGRWRDRPAASAETTDDYEALAEAEEELEEDETASEPAEAELSGAAPPAAGDAEGQAERALVDASGADELHPAFARICEQMYEMSERLRDMGRQIEDVGRLMGVLGRVKESGPAGLLEIMERLGLVGDDMRSMLTLMRALMEGGEEEEEGDDDADEDGWDDEEGEGDAAAAG